MWRTIALAASAGVVALASLGCASLAAPREARTETVAAIRAAREVGAEEAPRAAYHLDLAEQHLASADDLIRRGQMGRAARTLERAEADAELAIALAREAEVQSEAEETRARIQDMRERHL